MDVDEQVPSTSNFNGVFEPGEEIRISHVGVLARPTPERRASSTSLTAYFTGPAGAPYIVTDGAAGYGTLTPPDTADCLDQPDCWIYIERSGLGPRARDATADEIRKRLGRHRPRRS